MPETFLAARLLWQYQIPCQIDMNLDNLPIPVESPEAYIITIEGEQWVFYNGDKITPLGRKKALDDSWVHPEPGYEIGRCKMIKRDGERCKNPVRPGWTVCRSHGAGYPSRPGGLNDGQIADARHVKHLPNRLLDKFEEFLTDPEYVSMREEVALVDTRIAERLEMLSSSDTEAAWVKVRQVAIILDGDNISAEDIVKCRASLARAFEAVADNEVWTEVLELIERRRRLADTERRRIVDAQQMLTIQEANVLVATLMNIVMKHVKDPEIRRAIADEMKRIMT